MFYGNWNTTSASLADRNLIEYFLSNLAYSDYYMINSYYPFYPAGSKISGNVVYKGSVLHNTPGYSMRLSDYDIQNLVDSEPAWASKDPNGMYFVLTSPDVTATSGFCTSYCGWHDNYVPTSVSFPVRYSFVGNPVTKCLSGCSAGAGPNQLRGADAMVSIIAHELQESITDGLFDGYYSPSGYENADQCAWTFGTYYYVSGVGYWNVQVGTKNFLIQQNVDYQNYQTQTCSLSHHAIAQPAIGTSDIGSAPTIVPGTLSAQTNIFASSAANSPMTLCGTATGYDVYHHLSLSQLPASCTVDTCTSDFDTVVGVFSDSSGLAGTLVACNDNATSSTCTPGSSLSFAATSPNYWIGVGSSGTSLPGTYALNIICSTVRPTPSPTLPTTHNPTHSPSAPTSRRPTSPTHHRG